MKILLDHCVSHLLRTLLAPHEVTTTFYMGWSNLRNGELLRRASTEFDLLLSTDKNIRFQQSLMDLPVPVLELDIISQREDRLREAATHLPAAIEATRRYRFVSMRGDGQMECLAPRSP